LVGTVVLIVSILILDRVTKITAEFLLPLHGSVPVIKGFFHFTLVHNTGAAFGLFRNLVLQLVLATGFVLFFLWFSLMKAHRTPGLAAYRLPLCLVFGGALGNLVDRVFLGYVIDFLDFRIWPVFNIADSVITIGAVLLGIAMLRDSAQQ
jgi:signal peptidase II